MSKPAYLKFKRGEKLTRREAMGAQCYECNGYSLETKDDYLGVSCPLYGWSTWGKSLALRHSRQPDETLKRQLEAARGKRLSP